MSDMPRVIQAARSGLSAALRVEPEMLYAIDGDNSTPANPEFFTSYTRADLVDELIEGMLNAIEGADHNDDDSGSGANGSAYEAAATFKNGWLQGEGK